MGELTPVLEAYTLLSIAVMLLAAKFSGLIERFGQPPVLGELLTGVILGNLVFLGIGFFDPIKENIIIQFLADLGVIVLLFQVGLESHLGSMARVGVRALLVAVVGVILPFVLGAYIIGPLVLPGIGRNAYIFLGATLTATSVGITARVFRDLGRLDSREAQIVLGAAVIDDILGLIILAVVSAIVSRGSVSVGDVASISATAVLFLFAVVTFGQMLAPDIGNLLSKIQTGTGMKFTLAITFCLLFAYFAEQIGLAPIVGAFAAGLVLDPVHFRHFDNPKVIDDIKRTIHSEDPKLAARVDEVLEYHADRHIDDLIEPLSFFLVPIFFIKTGMDVDLSTLLDIKVVLIAIAVATIALAGKIAAGYVAGDVNKALVGWGMVPRGEVGLIFAAMGRSLGVVPDRLFSVIVIVIIFSTLITPPVLSYLLKRQIAQEEPQTVAQM